MKYKITGNVGPFPVDLLAELVDVGAPAPLPPEPTPPIFDRVIQPGDLTDKFWISAKNGERIGMADGVWRGTGSMIHPPAGFDQAITLTAVNDGKVLIDGEFERCPLYLYEIQNLTIGGINCAHGALDGTEQNVVVVSACDNIVIFRTGAWDALDQPDKDPVVWRVGNKSRNIFLEDIFGFGAGRYQFYTIGNVRNVHVSRAWLRFDQAVSLASKPRAVVLANYEGNEEVTFEDSILEYRASRLTTYESVSPILLLNGAGFNYKTPQSALTRFIGSWLRVHVDQNYHGGDGAGLGVWEESTMMQLDRCRVDVPADFGPAVAMYGTPPGSDWKVDLTQDMSHLSPWSMKQRIDEAIATTKWPANRWRR